MICADLVCPRQLSDEGLPAGCDSVDTPERVLIYIDVMDRPYFSRILTFIVEELLRAPPEPTPPMSFAVPRSQSIPPT